MEFVKLAELSGALRAQVPDCPVPAVTRALRDAAREMAQRTGISQETLDPVSVKADRPLVDLDAPSRSVRLYQVVWATIADLPITPIAQTELSRRAGWRSHTAETPRRFWREDPDQIRLYPIPSKDVTLTVRASFIPTRDAQEIDVALGDVWYECLLAGALYRLWAELQSPWGDANSALDAKFNFYRIMNRVRVAAERDGTRANRRAKPVPFV